MSIDNTVVTLDDTDPQLQWNGAWFPTTDVLDDLGHRGPPFLNTLHGISTNGSLTFSFYGASMPPSFPNVAEVGARLGRMVSVWGTVRPRNTTRGSDPTWQCIVDGTDIGSAWEYPDASYSNYLYCYGRNLPEGNHTLQFNTIIQSETLYVDSVQYQSAATADIGNAWTEVRQRDGRIKYSPGWITEDDGYRTWTYTPGAWLTFDFNGTGVIWGGYTPGNGAASTGGAQYMIDGEESRKSFEIPSRSGAWSNQPYFNVTGLKPGPHRLTVINSGNDSTTALGLAYMYMKNGAAEPERSKGTSAKVIGGAVGGSIGAVLLAVLAIFGTIWYRRRKRQRDNDASSMGGTTLGKPTSITPNSTGLKEQHTPGSPTLSPWGQPSSVLSHQASIISSNGPHSPSAFVAPLGYQPTTFATPPTGPNQPTNFAVPPGPNQPTMFVTHTNPNIHRGPSYNAAPGNIQPPTSFAAASSGIQPPSSFPTAPSGMQPPASFVSVPAPAPQQNALPMPSETHVQHIQDGKPDEVVEYNPYR